MSALTLDTSTESVSSQPDILGSSQPIIREAAAVGPPVPAKKEENAGVDTLSMTAEQPLPQIRPAVIEAHRLASIQAAQIKPPQIQVIERWQGVVSQVHADSFEARLVCSGGAATLPDEEGTFPLDLVSPDDEELVKEGALFTYTVGRETRGGTRRSVSIVAFRRMPFWHLRQVRDATLRAEKRAALLNERSGGSEQSTVAAASD